ncbi:hypothetical protein predicted by Glimmer/Critica [Sorangium cellulosum So ce56]|uniref:Uncharacterized protein n=1 Tax=Sorangium cellulosum (strain So ce56) TaxID=448385 RepID=A9GCX8_SORC5|nr:hypothetical protein predicted by Glimmer/Critica [Sorangium cellulosum So ce56]
MLALERAAAPTRGGVEPQISCTAAPNLSRFVHGQSLRPHLGPSSEARVGGPDVQRRYASASWAAQDAPARSRAAIRAIMTVIPLITMVIGVITMR